MNFREMLLAKHLLGSGGSGGSGGGGTGGGGGDASASAKDVNFYDYDGTLLHSYTVEEAQALSELPALPEREGLICQGWNWSLEDIKAHNRAVDVGATYITDDGKTRIYITLREGRTSPMLGVCPNGTVTVDWGDGTTPDTLTDTSTSTVKWTPNHEYTKPGDYVITLTVDGEMGLCGTSKIGSCILQYSSSVAMNAYLNSVQKVEVGSGVTSIERYAFARCYSLASITIPEGVTSIVRDTFNDCYSLVSITIPKSVTSIGGTAFASCSALASITIPEGVTSIGGTAFSSCYSLVSITIPKSVTSIESTAFNSCYSLASITIPEGVTSIGSDTFNYCYSLASITIPKSVTSIGQSAFSYCRSVRYYDFTKHTAVPTLSGTNAFNGIATDCEIRVPAALYDEWIAATNWSIYASQIVAV